MRADQELLDSEVKLVIEHIDRRGFRWKIRRAIGGGDRCPLLVERLREHDDQERSDLEVGLRQLLERAPAILRDGVEVR